MISRVTLFSLLLALLLGAGIRVWALGQRDDCARALEAQKQLPPGEKKLPASQYVITGTRVVVVPCTEWLPRQTMPVQVLCLADLVLAAVFVVNGLGDVKRRVRVRGEAG